MSAVKGVLIFLGGSTIGGAASWFFTKRYFEKKVDSTINEAIASIEKVEEESKSVEVNANVIADVISAACNYVPAKDEIKKEAVVKIEEKEEPKLVDFDMWAENNGLNKVTLIWYKGDDTLATEQDAIVSDDIYILGKSFREEFDECGYQYRYNKNNSTVYEVILSEKTYYEEVGAADISEEGGISDEY